MEEEVDVLDGGLDFDSATRIDKHNLDEEWARHTKLYSDWATAYAQATLERDRAKQNLEVTRATLDKQIRTNPNFSDKLLDPLKRQESRYEDSNYRQHPIREC